MPMLFVCEEAHRYAPADHVRRLRADPPRPAAHRQGGAQIRRLPRPRHPAAGRARSDDHLPMQHAVRDAHGQRPRPGAAALGGDRRGGQSRRLRSLAGHARSRRLRRRLSAADAPELQVAARRSHSAQRNLPACRRARRAPDDERAFVKAVVERWRGAAGAKNSAHAKTSERRRADGAAQDRTAVARLRRQLASIRSARKSSSVERASAVRPAIAGAGDGECERTTTPARPNCRLCRCCAPRSRPCRSRSKCSRATASASSPIRRRPSAPATPERERRRPRGGGPRRPRRADRAPRVPRRRATPTASAPPSTSTISAACRTNCSSAPISTTHQVAQSRLLRRGGRTIDSIGASGEARTSRWRSSASISSTPSTSSTAAPSATRCSSKPPSGSPSQLDDGDIAARTGGDEFSLLIAQRGETPTTVRAKIDRVLSRFKDPFYVDGLEILISASAGFSLFPAARRRRRRPDFQGGRGADAGQAALQGRSATLRTRRSPLRAQERARLEQSLRLAVRDRRFLLRVAAEGRFPLGRDRRARSPHALARRERGGARSRRLDRLRR